MFRGMVALSACLALGCGGELGEPPLLDGGPGSDSGSNGDLLDFVPSNVPVDHLVVGTAHVTIDVDATIDTESGAVTDAGGNDLLPVDSIFVLVPQDAAGAPTLGVFSWADLEIASGVTVTVKGANGLVLALSDSGSIDGVILARGGIDSPEQPGPGGFAGGDDTNPDGFGPGGGLTEGGYDAGGGGGGYGALGGAGGKHEGSPGGQPGAAYGTAENVPLLGGSGGARGGASSGGGFGGGGGGAVQISARGQISVGKDGGINVGGGGGAGGDNDRGGGAGGSGGAILLEARSIVVQGALAANGGGGGAGANQGNQGDSGEPGALSATAALGGDQNPDGSAGGVGAAGEIMIGGDGVATNVNSGGGGGGGGRIFLRSREGAQTGTALLTPSGALDTGVL